MLIVIFVEIIVEIFGKLIDFKFDLFKLEGDWGRCVDYEKVCMVFGWLFCVDLKDGFEFMYCWVEV